MEISQCYTKPSKLETSKFFFVIHSVVLNSRHTVIFTLCDAVTMFTGYLISVIQGIQDPNLHNQCYRCWWPGDTRSWDINSHVVDLVAWNTHGEGEHTAELFWKKLNMYLLFTSFPDINSLAPGRSECDSKNGIFNLVLLIFVFISSHDNALCWMPQDLTDYKSTLVQVMAWCRQATSHYLSQCWPRSMSPYGVTRPQWVKTLPVIQIQLCKGEKCIKIIFDPSNIPKF